MTRTNTLLGVFACGALLMATPVARAAPAAESILLATTTSTQDSGLLDVLLPAFERETGYGVKTISVGSGQAMALGRRGCWKTSWVSPRLC